MQTVLLGRSAVARLKLVAEKAMTLAVLKLTCSLPAWMQVTPKGLPHPLVPKAALQYRLGVYKDGLLMMQGDYSSDECIYQEPIAQYIDTGTQRK
jgi:hypothetical protein